MKSSCALAALLLVAYASSIQASEDVPVFVWGKPSVTYVPALAKYSTSEFAALIESQADENTFALVFAEERLSTEDLSQCKLKTQTCFRNLAKVERKSYLPNVQEPLGAFEDIPAENIQSVQLSADGSLSERIVPKGGAVAIVNLSGNDFASHDALIDSLYNRLRAEFPNILAVYTGKTPSFRYSALVSRTRRQAQQEPEEERETKMLKVDNAFMMAYEGFKAGPSDQLEEVAFTGISKVADNSTESTLQIDITGTSAKLSLYFHLTSGSWEIAGVTYNNEQYYLRHRVHLNQHFSYHCYSLEYYTMDMKKMIVLEEVQLQPFWPAEGETVERFGDAWDCVGFTSPGILTGLFLLVIFIFIGAYGITWMMDIRTMDRFDDPKGKTITVNVAE